MHILSILYCWFIGTSVWANRSASDSNFHRFELHVLFVFIHSLTFLFHLAALWVYPCRFPPRDFEYTFFFAPRGAYFEYTGEYVLVTLVILTCSLLLQRYCYCYYYSANGSYYFLSTLCRLEFFFWLYWSCQTAQWEFRLFVFYGIWYYCGKLYFNWKDLENV